MSLFSHVAIYAIFVMNPAGVINNPPEQAPATYVFAEEEKQRTYESLEDCTKDLKKAETEWSESVHNAFARLGGIREDDTAFQTQQARIDSLSCEKIDDVKTRNNNADIARKVREQIKAEMAAQQPKPQPVQRYADHQPQVVEQYVDPVDEVQTPSGAPAPSPMAVQPPTYRGGPLMPTRAFYMAENGRKLDGTFGWVKYATAYPSPASCWSAVKQIIKDDEARLQQAFSTMRPDYSAMSWYQTKMVELQTRKRSLSCVTD